MRRGVWFFVVVVGLYGVAACSTETTLQSGVDGKVESKSRADSTEPSQTTGSKDVQDSASEGAAGSASLGPVTSRTVREDPATTSSLQVTTTTELVDWSGFEVITFRGLTYVCEDNWGEWECGRCAGDCRPEPIVFADIFCDSAWQCSEFSTSDWDGFKIITYGFEDFVCERGLFGSEWECSRCWGSCTPEPVLFADLYCDDFGNCSEYSQRDWEGFEVITVQGREYICEDTWGEWKCELCWMECAPEPVWAADLYCDESWQCSEFSRDDWRGYEVISFGYSNYVCQSTWSGYECRKCWSACEPTPVWSPDLYCDSSFRCSEFSEQDWYGYEVIRFSGSDYVCESTWNGYECRRCWGTCEPTPVWSPDLYCDRSWRCGYSPF